MVCERFKIVSEDKSCGIMGDIEVWNWELLTANNRVIAVGRGGYTTKAAAKRAARTVKYISDSPIKD